MTGPLITAPELAAALRSPAPAALIDVRWRFGGPPGLSDYRHSHIPGAHYVDLDTELAARPGPRGRHPLPAPDQVESAMRRAGVRTDRPVVVYDPDDSTIAARAWWLLVYLGHPDVHVLDGGLRAWKDAGLPVATGDEAPAQPGDFVAKPGARPFIEVREAATWPNHGILLDARAPERYRGEVEPIDSVAGHIPGAKNAPTRDNVDPLGHFLPPDQLRKRFADLGVEAGMEVAAYCGSGVTAAHEVLALEVAGIPASLYPGSWSEWVADPSRPIATGDM